MRKTYPTEARFLLADAIREEVGGKVSVMGLYSGDELILQGELPRELPEKAPGIALPSICILITMFGAQGKFKIDLKVRDPKGKELGVHKGGELSITKGSPQNIMLPLTPFPIRGFGEYLVEAILDDKVYKYKFIVRHQDPKARLPTHKVATADNKTTAGSKKKK